MHRRFVDDIIDIHSIMFCIFVHACRGYVTLVKLFVFVSIYRFQFLNWIYKCHEVFIPFFELAARK